MEYDDHLQQLLHEAADLGDQPVADVPGIVRRARRVQRRRRALRAGGIAVVALLAGFAVAAADTDAPEDVSTVDAPTAHDDRAEFDRPEPSYPGEAEPAEETTTTTEAATEERDQTTTTTTPLDPGPLRLVVSTSVLAPYASLSVRSEDPCPAESSHIHVTSWSIGGTMNGISVGGTLVEVDPTGHWSVEYGLVAVGAIENVAWAQTAPEIEVRAVCSMRNVMGAEYAPVRVRNEPVAVVPELTATWDGQTATIEYSGCPTAYRAYLVWGDAMPPLDQRFPLEQYVSEVATPGTAPDSWVATIDLPGYNTSDGLWATAYCHDSAGVSPIWRYLPFELDPPG